MVGVRTRITKDYLVWNNLLLIIERWRDEWDLLLWKSSDEYREMVHERLTLHKKAMNEGGESPYFKAH